MKIKLIEIIEGIEGKKYILPNKSEITIGRSPKNDIQTPKSYDGVSREHCKIYQGEQIISVIDLSTNGTFINGKRVPKDDKKYLLKDGDEFRLYNYNLKIKISNTNISEEEMKDLIEIEKEMEQGVNRVKLEGSATGYDFTQDMKGGNQIHKI